MNTRCLIGQRRAAATRVSMSHVVANHANPFAVYSWTTHRNAFPNAAKRTFNCLYVSHCHLLSTNGTFSPIRNCLFSTGAAENVITGTCDDRLEWDLATDRAGKHILARPILASKHRRGYSCVIICRIHCLAFPFVRRLENVILGCR